MLAHKFLVCLLPILVGAAHAQDDRTVTSPDGQLEFRVFTTLPGGAQLNSLAYQVRWHGKLVIDTSCLGLNIHFQEPFLGENVGLSSSKPSDGAGYNGLIADYLQNSSTGRRIGLEVRVYNDAAAFRYIVPQQWPLLDLLIEDEVTEFHFAGDRAQPEQGALPYVEQAPGGWVGVFDDGAPGLPPMSLVRSDAHTMMSHLPDTPKDPGVAFVGVTPWTGPWRIVALSQDRDRLAHAAALQALRH
ncbi:MAG: glycoside hydrolase family 97 N-terminal domain-containing protein [Ignavibacteriota bacterium]